MSDEKRFFTWAEFDKLSALQATLIRMLYEELCGQTFPKRSPHDAEKEEETEDELDSVLDLYMDSDGCVPSHHLDDDVFIPILKKFRGPVDVAIDLVETELIRLGRGKKYTLRRVIQPSHEDECTVVVIDWRDGYPFVYYENSRKAWNYHFGSLSELAQEVETIRGRILRTYTYLHNNRDFKLPLQIPEED